MVPLIRELLTDEEYAELLRRMVQVYGPPLNSRYIDVQSSRCFRLRQADVD